MATFLVNSTADAVDGTPLGDGRVDVAPTVAGNQITLRAAIQEANALFGDDTVQLPAGTFALSLGYDPANGDAAKYEDNSLKGDLDITDGLTIQGAGADKSVITASGIDRVFQVFAGVTLNLTGATVTGGTAVGQRSGFIYDHYVDWQWKGSGIYNSGRLFLDNCTITGNKAGLANSIPAYGGGGIYNIGAGAAATVTNCVISNNEAGPGGGIYNFDGASLSILNSTISGNRATFGRGGAWGGAIYNWNATVTIDKIVVSDNTADEYSGIFSDGNSVVRVSGSASFTGDGIAQGDFWGTSKPKLVISHAMFSGGSVFSSSGEVTISDSVFSEVSVHNSRHSNVSITRSEFDASGGFAVFSSNGSVSLDSSTISGSGLSVSTASGTMIVAISNSTISGNSGPGMVLSGQGQVTVANTTVTGNTSGISASGNVKLKNTIVAGNTEPDVSGSFTSLGHNLIGNVGSATGFTNGVNGDQVGSSASPIDPKLGPLQDNGGPTFTQALLPGSPVIDAGDNVGCPATDQRGVSRPQGAACDIGAFEFTTGPSVTFTASGERVTENAGRVTITLQLSAASTQDVTVPFTVSGTATSPDDYTITPPPVTIRAGSTTGTITVVIFNDSLVEPDETVVFTMGTPTNATAGAITTNTLTISDGAVVPGLPTVQFASASQTVAENVGTVTITAQLSAVSAQNVTVPFAVSGTAISPGNYGVTASPFTILAGMTTGIISISLVNDSLAEPDETIIVTMGTPINAMSGAVSLHTVTITDDDLAPPVTPSIHGQMFHDLDRDGEPDSAEPRLDGWTIELRDKAGDVVGTTISRSVDLNGDRAIDPATEQGLYAFTDLLPGTYTLREALQPGWRQTHPRDLVFSDRVNFSVGDAPSRVTAADLDGDGHLDLAVANQFSNNLSLLMNNGDGSFTAGRTLAVERRPSALTAADLDGDRDLDLVVTNGDSDNMSVLLNQGGGSFAAAVNFAAGDFPNSVMAGDLDGDGDIDLSMTNSRSNNVSVLLNNGNASFTAGATLPVGQFPTTGTAADHDGDGDLDLVVPNRDSSTVSVLRNLGNGTFAAALNYTVGDSPFSVAAGDIDKDGDLDLAVANGAGFGGTPSVSVLLNRGDGSFATATNYAAGDFPNRVVAADLDGDGHLDLAVAGGDQVHQVLVLHNNGDGTFAPAVSFVAGSFPIDLTAQDLDRDGDLDLVVVNSVSDDVSVLRNLLGTYTVTLNSGQVFTGKDFGNFRFVAPVTPQAVPYSQGFSSGKPGAADGWEYYSANQGRIRVVVDNLVMDDSTADSTYSLNEAILHLDVSGRSGLRLKFNHANFSDENSPLPNVFTGHADGDGVAFSADGVTWYRLIDLTEDFFGREFDLDAAVHAAGISYSSDFRIKFQQYDNYSLGSTPQTSDGREIDNISITVQLPTVEFASASRAAAENVGSVTISVQLSAASVQDVTVPFAVSGTATDPTDYTITPSPITIPAGMRTGTITISVVNDGIVEPDETVIVTMGTPTNATLGTARVSTVTIAAPDTTGPRVQGAQIVPGGRSTVREVLLTFSEQLKDAAAVSSGNYRLLLPGRDKLFGTSDDQEVSLRVPVYNPAMRQVHLIPDAHKPLRMKSSFRIMVVASRGLTDLQGNSLDGNGDGNPGDDFSVTVTRPR